MKLLMTFSCYENYYLDSAVCLLVELRQESRDAVKYGKKNVGISYVFVNTQQI